MVLSRRRLLLLLRSLLLRQRHQVAPVVHRVVLPGLAEPRLEVPQVEVLEALVAPPVEVLEERLGLEVLLELEVLLAPEPLPLVRQAQLLELFLLLVLQLRVLEWLVWSALP